MKSEPTIGLGHLPSRRHIGDERFNRRIVGRREIGPVELPQRSASPVVGVPTNSTRPVSTTSCLGVMVSGVTSAARTVALSALLGLPSPMIGCLYARP
jgi:hypothetical protein